MRIYRVGIVGHRPERFRNAELARSICRDTVLTLSRQYDDLYFQFNIGGCTGVDHWVAEMCLEYEMPFNLYLPFPSSVLSAHWYQEQRDALELYIDNCSSLTTVGPDLNMNNFEVAADMMIQNSDFIVCFWEGCLQGGTFLTIQRALKDSKIVLNGLRDLSLISKQQLNRKIEA